MAGLQDKVYLLNPRDYKEEDWFPADKYAYRIGEKDDGPVFMLQCKGLHGKFSESAIAVFPGLKGYEDLKGFEEKLDKSMAEPWSAGRLGLLIVSYEEDYNYPNKENTWQIKELEADMVSHLAWLRRVECHEYDRKLKPGKFKVVRDDIPELSGVVLVHGYHKYSLPMSFYEAVSDNSSRWVTQHKVNGDMLFASEKEVKDFGNLGKAVEYMASRMEEDFQKYGLGEDERTEVWNRFVKSLRRVGSKPFVPKYSFDAYDPSGNKTSVTCELGLERVLEKSRDLDRGRGVGDDAADIEVVFDFFERKKGRGLER